jgi:hypothetical protein
MSLPINNPEWPPKDCAEPNKKYREWNAWYAGDPAKLMDVYQAGSSPVPGLDLKPHPATFRGGLVGAVARMWWGAPASPGQLTSPKLHVPAAGDLAATSADLLYGTPPTLKVGDDPKSKTQQRLDYLFDDGGISTSLLEGAEVSAAFGGRYLRVSTDPSFCDEPIVDAVPPDAAVPEWRYGRLAAVTFWRELASDPNGITWRHLERHEPGRVYHGLYRGTSSRLGIPMALADNPATEVFAPRVNEEGFLETGAEGLAVEYVPNTRPHRLIRGTPLGRSDYQGVEGIMDALDEAWCADEQTEILTDHGWVNYRDLHEGDNVLTLNHTTGLSEWQPVLEVCVFPAKEREMISIESRSHSSLTTPNHRWPVLRLHFRGGMAAGRYKRRMGVDREWATSSTFQWEDQVPIAADCADLPADPKHSDALVEAVAWFWTEGHIRKLRDGRQGRNVTITQAVKAIDHCEMIRSALTRLFGPPVEKFPRFGKALTDGVPRWREWVNGGKQEFGLNADAGALLQAYAPGRVPSHHFLMSLTKAQLELFIHVSMEADNCGQHMLAQKDRAAAEAFQFACILAGYGSTFSMRSKVGRVYNPGCVMWQARIRTQRVLWAGRSTRNRVTYSGEVWCPRTPNQTWLARRRGKIYFTGNTSWLRDLRLAKARLIVPDIYMQNLGRGQGAWFDAEQEIFTRLNMLPGPDGSAGMLTPVQFEIRFEAHQETTKALFAQVVKGAGYSVQTFGEAGQVATTAREIDAREDHTDHTRGRKIRYERAALRRFVLTLLQVDKSTFGNSVEPEPPEVEWPEDAPDPEQTARTVQLLDAAEAVSTKTKVEMVHPDWDGDQVEREVVVIRSERGLAQVPEPDDGTGEPDAPASDDLAMG